MAQTSHTVTCLLEQWRSGDQHAGALLMERVYSDLHAIAAREMRRERKDHTLQTTALVHEAFLRLCGSNAVAWTNRAHFFAVAARQMRRVLVDHARRRRAEKRGGSEIQLALWESDGSVWQLDENLLALDEALTTLQTLDERAANVVELRFFGGLSEEETAQAVGVSLATLKRDWDFARTWIASRLA